MLKTSFGGQETRDADLAWAAGTAKTNAAAVPKRQSGWYWAVKRGFDVVSAILLLVVLFPLMLLISAAIKLTSKGPVIYKHRRFGKGGRPIEILKFRTMREGADQQIGSFTPEQQKEWLENYKLDHDPRVTGIGKLLRVTSLDELPQLVNVIKGELSMIGPRPIIAEELEKYGENKEKFLSITPGLTGYWQAYARSDCSYEQRMQMELEYVENANLAWDIRILFASVRRVVCCRGAK